MIWVTNFTGFLVIDGRTYNRGHHFPKYPLNNSERELKVLWPLLFLSWILLWVSSYKAIICMQTNHRISVWTIPYLSLNGSDTGIKSSRIATRLVADIALWIRIVSRTTESRKGRSNSSSADGVSVGTLATSWYNLSCISFLWQSRYKAHVVWVLITSQTSP